MSMMTRKPDSYDPCCCSQCVGLETAERPLFGTGQTLTAADLTSLQDYVKSKNRLHNRYQHGWGVVCGLEVLCHDCEGSVTIRPGYAIDPCGDDIVVADAVRYDVIEAIRNCTRIKRQRTDDCDPWVPPRDEGCDEALTHWCVALRYREVETAVGQRLTTGGTACETLGKSSTSCDCSGSSGCGCQKCETSRTRPIANYRSNTLTASNACAPRRIRECFDVELIPRSEPCAPSFPQRDPQDSTQPNEPLGLIGWLIPEKSLLRNILNCVINDVTEMTDRMSAQDSTILSQLASSSATELAASDISLDDVHGAICRVRAVVLDLIQDDHGTTRCQLLRATAEVKLAPPARGTGDDIIENRADYIARAQQMASDLLAAWIQSILDCICRAFLPPCPEDPCDDRVEVACLSAKGGKILSICNHSCRKYAGAFPSTIYWMSLIPIIPLFAKMLAMLCCRPDLLRRNSPLVNDLIPLLDRVDATGGLRRKFVENDFETPRRWAAMAAKFSDTPVLAAISEQLERGATALIDPASVPTEQDSTDDMSVKELQKELQVLKADVAALKSKKAPTKRSTPTKKRTTKKTPKSTKPK